MRLRKFATLTGALLSSALLAQEICTNGIDDNGNGLIDLNDPECACNTLIAPPDLSSYIRNHSFEERACCPYDFVSNFGPSWLDCATGWRQATSSTSDYFHECGYHPAGMPWPPPDGDGAVGFYAQESYKEYVGTCLTFPQPSNPLIAGTTYTLSLWIVGASVNGTHSQTLEEGLAVATLFTDQMPLAIFGYANACVAFPVSVPPGVNDCIGGTVGWNELGRVLVQPSAEWVRLSITFTPTEDIHSIMIGGACDVPASFSDRPFTNSQGVTTWLAPYFMVDELLLTEAQDQVLTPVSYVGHVCTNDVVVTANPPVGATGHQWYLNGVAIVGQTGTTLNASALGLGAGTYALTSTYDGQCLMGTTNVPGPIVPAPLPVLDNVQGCAPLTVSFADTTGIAVVSSSWDFGDGTSAIGDSVVHTYTSPGTYDVTLRVTTSLGCVRDSVLVGAVVVWSDPLAVITATPNPGDADDPMVVLSGSSSTGGVVSWWWDLGAATPNSSGDIDVTATFPSAPGSYPVVLVVENSNGCVDTVSTIVVLVRNGDIRMPNIFSPNGDGGNDAFIPLDYTGAPGRLEIYNRWGQLLLSTTDLGSGWNGMVNGSEAPAGTYYYVVEPTSAQGERTTGHLTLVR
jgi:gliding motility-associated-like protein